MKPTARILFVDDHQDTLDLFEIVFSQQNYEVVTASSVARALDETMQRQFDLLVLDSHLEDGSGVDLCRRIRETGNTTPILFCSGLAYEKNKQEAMKAGAQAYLVKPVSIDGISDAIKELISKRRRSASSAEGRVSGDLPASAPPM